MMQWSSETINDSPYFGVNIDIVLHELCNNYLGVRYTTSGLAISANRLAIRPPAKTADGAREARPRCFVDEGVVLLSDLR